MTHEHNVDDGDLEIEAWEKAEIELIDRSLDETQRTLLWMSLRSAEAEQAEQLIVEVMTELGCGPEEAHRILHALNGREL